MVLPISSECPKCRERRAIIYTRDAVLARLRAGQPISVNCAGCSIQWHLSPRERAAVSRGLSHAA